MAVIAVDTFVEGSDTTLASHTPTGSPAGTGWTLEAQSGAALFEVEASSDQIKVDTAENSDGLVYSIQPDPTTGDYDVEWTVPTVDTAQSVAWVGLMARHSATDDRYVGSIRRAASDPDVSLDKKVSGTWTNFAEGNIGPLDNDVFRLEVRSSGATRVELFENGTSRLSSGDTAITADGKWGFVAGAEARGVSTDGLHTNFRLDDFKVTDQAAAALGNSEIMAAVGQLMEAGGMVGRSYI